MKKFMIFFLMVFLYIGTSQARSETTTFTTDDGKGLTDWVVPSQASNSPYFMIDGIDVNPDTIYTNVRNVTIVNRDTVQDSFTLPTVSFFTLKGTSPGDTLFYPGNISGFTGFRDIYNNPTLSNGQVFQYRLNDPTNQLGSYNYDLKWILGTDTVKTVSNSLNDMFFADPSLLVGNYTYKLQGSINLVDTFNTHTRTLSILDLTIVDTTFRPDSAIASIDTIWIDSAQTIVDYIDTTYSYFNVVDYIDTIYVADTLSDVTNSVMATGLRASTLVNETVPYRVIDNAGFTINAGTRYRCSEGAVEVRVFDWLALVSEANITGYENYKFSGLDFNEEEISTLNITDFNLVSSGPNSATLSYTDTVFTGENAYLTVKYLGYSMDFPYQGTFWTYENILVSEKPEIVLNSVRPDQIRPDGTIDSILCAGSEFVVNLSINGGLDLDLGNINAVLSIYKNGSMTPDLSVAIDSGDIFNYSLDTLLMENENTSYICVLDYVQKNDNASLRNYGCAALDTFGIRAYTVPVVDFYIADSLYTSGSVDSLEVCVGYNAPISFVGTVDTNFRDSIMDVNFIFGSRIETVQKPSGTVLVYLNDTVFDIQQDTTIICEIQINDLCSSIDTFTIATGVPEMTITFADTTVFCATGDSSLLLYENIEPLINGRAVNGSARAYIEAVQPAPVVPVEPIVVFDSGLVSVDFSVLTITEPIVYKLVIEDSGSLGCYVKDSIWFIANPPLTVDFIDTNTFYPVVCNGGENTITAVIKNFNTGYEPLLDFTYSWVKDTTAAGSDTLAPIVITSINDSIIELTNVLNGVGEYSYYLIYELNGGQCAGISDPIITTVVGTPSTNLPTDTTICFESSFTVDTTKVFYDPLLSGFDFTYAWTTTNSTPDTIQSNLVTASGVVLPTILTIDSALINTYYAVNPNNDVVYFNFGVTSDIPGCFVNVDSAVTVNIYGPDTLTSLVLSDTNGLFILPLINGELKGCISDLMIDSTLMLTATFGSAYFGDTVLTSTRVISPVIAQFPDTTYWNVQYQTMGCNTIIDTTIQIVIFASPDVALESTTDECENIEVNFVANADASIYKNSYQGIDSLEYSWAVDSLSAGGVWTNIYTYTSVTHAYSDTLAYQLPFANGLSDSLRVVVNISNLTVPCESAINSDTIAFNIYTAALINGGSDTVCENAIATSIPLSITPSQSENIHVRILYGTDTVVTYTKLGVTEGVQWDTIVNILENYPGNLLVNGLDTFTQGVYGFEVQVWQSPNFNDIVACNAKDSIFLSTKSIPVISNDYTYIRFCENNSTTINLEATGTSLQYSWYYIDSLLNDTIFVSNDSVTFETGAINRAPQSTVEYLVVVTSTEGNCSDSSIVSLVVATNPNDNVMFDPMLSVTDTFCGGIELTLDATPITALSDFATIDDTVSYIWTQLSPAPSQEVYSGEGDTSFILNNTTGSLVPYYYSVEVTTSGFNCPSVVSYTDTVVIKPTLEVYITPSQDTVCEGGSVAIDADIIVADPNALIHYQWYHNGISLDYGYLTYNDYISNPHLVDISTPSNANENLENPNAEYYYLHVWQTGSSVDQYCDSRYTDPIRITVMPDPNVLLLGDILVDKDSIVTYTASVLGGYEDSTITYQWFIDNVAQIGDTNSIFTTTFAAAGTYSVKCEVTQPCPGCQAIGELTVTVQSLEVQDVVITANGSSNDVVSCEPVVLSSNMPNNGNYTYNWYCNGVLVQSGYDATYTTTQDGNYSVVILNGADTVGVTINTINVTVQDMPTVVIYNQGHPAGPINVGLYGNNIPITQTFNAHLDGGEGTNYTYQWYINGMPIAVNGTSENYSATDSLAVGTYYYTVVVTDSETGCTAVSAPVQANVVSGIIVNIEGNNTGCEGSTIRLVAVIENDDIGYDLIEWKRDGNYILEGHNSLTLEFLLSDSTEGDYQVVVTRQGCEDTYSPVFTVNSIEAPVVQISGTQICPNGTATLVANSYSSLVEQPYRWIWYQVDTATNTVIASTTTYVNTLDVTEAGHYYVEAVYQTEECNSQSDITEVTPIDSLFTIGITPSTAEVCDGGQVNMSIITGVVPAGAGVPTYQWYENGAAIPGATLNYYNTIPFTGNISTTTYTYYVEVTYSNYPCPLISDVATVTVQPAFNVTINGNQDVCAGTDINLTAVVNNFNGDPEEDLLYEWRLNGMALNTADTVYDTTAIASTYLSILNPQSFRIGDTLFTATTDTIFVDSVYVVTSTDSTMNLDLGDTNYVYNAPYAYYYNNTTYNYNSHYFDYVQTTGVIDSVEFPMYIGLADTVNNTSDWTDTIYTFVENVYNIVDTATIDGTTPVITSSDPALVFAGMDTLYTFKENVYVNQQVVNTLSDTIADFNERGSNLLVADGIPFDTNYTFIENVYTRNSATDTNYIVSNTFFADYTTTHNGPLDTSYTFIENILTAIDTIYIDTIPYAAHSLVPAETQTETYLYIGEIYELSGTTTLVDTVNTIAEVPTSVTDTMYTITDSIEVLTFSFDTLTFSTEQTLVDEADTVYEVLPMIIDTNTTHFTQLISDSTAYVDIINNYADTLCNFVNDTLIVTDPATYTIIDTITSTVALSGGVDTMYNLLSIDTITVSPAAYLTGWTTGFQAGIFDAGQSSVGYTLTPYSMPTDTNEPNYANKLAGYNLALNLNPDSVGALHGSVDGIANGSTLTMPLDSVTGYADAYQMTAFDIQTAANYFNPVLSTVVLKVIGEAYDTIPVAFNTAYGQAYRNTYRPLYLQAYLDSFPVAFASQYNAETYVYHYEVSTLDYNTFYKYACVEQTYDTTFVYGRAITLRDTIYEYNTVINNYDTLYEYATGNISFDTTYRYMEQVLYYDTTFAYDIAILGYDTLYSYYVRPINIDTTYKYNISYMQYDSVTVYDTIYHYDVAELQPVLSSALVNYNRAVESFEVFYRPTYTAATGENTDYPGSAYPYVFEVVAYNNNGCISTSAQFNVNVQEQPIVHVSVSGTEVCPGTEITVTAEVDNWDLNNLTFVWNDGIHTGPSFTTIVYDSAEFFVNATHISGCTTVSDTATVAVRPIIPVLATADVTAATVCDGATITLNGSAQGTGILTYQWYANGVAIAGATQPTSTHVAEVIGGATTTYQYSLLVISSGDSYCNNSGAGSDTAIAAGIVTVYPDPTVTVTGDNVICENGTITLTPNVLGGIGVNTYSWFLNNVPVDLSQASVDPNGVLTVPNAQNSANEPNGVYSYTVNVAQATGCEVTSVPFNVEVKEAPVASVIITDNNICAGGQFNVNAQVNDWNINNLTYAWTANGTAIANTTASFDATANATTIYEVTITQTTSGCATTGSATVTVNTPTVTMDAIASATICEGEQVVLNANTANDDNLGTPTYQWFANGQVIPGAITSTYTYSPIAIDGDVTIYTYTVQVTYPESGCVISPASYSGNIVTVNANPIVVISGDNIVCENGTISLTANVTNGSANTYTWYNYNTPVSGTTSNLVITPAVVSVNQPNGVYSYTVVVNEGTGCAATSAPFNVSVNAAPVVDVIITDDQICAGGTFNVSAQVNDWNIADLTYAWTANGTAIANTTAAFNATANATTTYEVTITQTTSGCVAIGSETVTVNTPTITMAAITNMTICEGEQVVLTATTANDDNLGTPTYQWFANGQAIAGAVTSTYTYSPVAIDGDQTIYTYTVQATYPESGCVITPASYTSNVVTVNANPVVAISGDNIVCENGIISLTANVTNGTANTYTWYNYNTLVSTDTNLVITPAVVSVNQPNGVYSYTVVVNEGTPCAAVSAPFDVAVNATPVVDVIITDDQICAGGTFNVSAQVNDWNIADLTYAWTANGTAIANTTATFDATANVTTTYEVTITQTTSGCVATGSASVTVNMPTIAMDSISNIVICEGEQVVLTATTANDDNLGTPTYQWFANGQAIAGAVTSTYTYSPVAIDGDQTIYTYTVQATYPESGCVITPATYTSNVVTVNANPVVVISGDNIVCENGTISLTANVTNGTANTYTWYNYNTLVSTDTNLVITPAVVSVNQPNGVYSYTVVVNEGTPCAAVSAPFDVAVNATPVVDVIITDDQICAGGTFNVSAQVNDWNIADLTYVWTANGTAIANTTATFDATANVTTTYEVTITQTTSGCVATGSASVTVNTPIVVMDPIALTSVCEGAQVTLVANTSNDANLGEPTYQWFANGQAIPGAVTSTYTYSPLSTDGDQTIYTYTVQVTYPESGCVIAPASYTSNVVTVNANPVVVISGDNIVCENGTISLTANVTNGTANTYTWYNYNSQVGGNTANLVISPAQVSINQPNGVYSYTVVVNEGNPCAAVSASFDVTVNAAPIVDVIITDDQICAGGTFNVSAQVNDWNINNLTYAWRANGSAIANTTASFDATANVTTTYQVTITQTTSGCTAVGSAAVTVNTPTVVMAPIATTNVCEGAQVTLVATTSNDANLGEPTYQWFANGQAIMGAVTSTYTYSPLSTDGDQTIYTYTVQVTYPESGCVITPASYTSNVVTVNANPVVVISGDNIVCENGTISLTANVTNGTANTYTWYNYNAQVAGSTNNLVINPAVPSTNQPNGVYSYTVVVNQGNPCAVVSAPFEVTVNETPMVDVIITDDQICSGGTFNVSAQVNDWNINNLTYVWTANGATIANTTASFNATANATTTYQVTITQTTSGCTAVGSAAVTVNTPTVVMAPIATTNVCEGAQVTLVATTANDANLGEPAYQWFANGQAIPGAVTSTYTYSPIANGGNQTIYTYTVQVTYPESGCVIAPASYTSNVVTVNADPVVVISGDNIVCENGTISLNANVTNGTATTYTWYNYNTQVSGTTANLVVDPAIVSINQPNGVYSYTVVVNEGTPCAAVSAPFNVTVNETPVVTVSATANTVCVGAQVTLTANLDNYNASDLTYQWSDANGIINGATSATYTTPIFTNSTNYTYNVQVTQITSGCTAMNSTTIAVVADPVINVSIDTAAMCTGGTVTLSAQVTGGINTENVLYTWSVNGSTINGATQASYTTTINEAGIYNYTAGVAQSDNYYVTGCASTNTSVATVTVYDQPDVFISSMGLIDACEGGTVTLYAQVYGDPAIISSMDYDWRINGWDTLSVNSSIYNTNPSLPVGSYVYTVVVTTDLMACRVVSDAINTSVVEDPSWSRNIVAYPEICVGDEITLYAQVQDGLGGIIQWVREDTTLYIPTEIGTGGLTYDIPEANGYIYYPVYTPHVNMSGCELANGDSTLVIVHARPTATASTVAGSDVICAGESADIMINFTGLAPYTYYVQNMMTGEAVEFSTFNNPDTLTVYPTETTIYQIYQMSNSICDVAANEAAVFVSVVVSNIEFTDVIFDMGCDTANLDATLTFDVISGGYPAQQTYTVYTADGIFVQTGAIVSNSLTIDMTGYAAGDYDFLVDIDSCTYPVSVRVKMNSTVVEQRWDDVLVCNNNPANNGGYTFVSYQWYKNGAPIAGATGQYYNEIGGLNGEYYLWIKDENGNEYWTCPQVYRTDVAISVYPNPATVEQEITIELPFTPEQLDGAVLDIYDAKGALVQHVNTLQPITKVSGFKAQGAYFGRILTGTNEIKTVKFIIVK